jgi:hypothetical protein
MKYKITPATRNENTPQKVRKNINHLNKPDNEPTPQKATTSLVLTKECVSGRDLTKVLSEFGQLLDKRSKYKLNLQVEKVVN